jgi:hypothetical protein
MFTELENLSQPELLVILKIIKCQCERLSLIHENRHVLSNYILNVIKKAQNSELDEISEQGLPQYEHS